MGLSRSESGKLGAFKTIVILKARKLERIEKYNQNKCPMCGISIVYEKRINKYCSRSCAAKLNNSTYPKRRKTSTGKIIFERKYKKEDFSRCQICDNQTKGIYNKFCSVPCHIKSKWNATKFIIESTGNVKSSQIAKKYLIETRGKCCEICNLTSEWNRKPIVFILDHIDGNSENNFISNLRLVCPNCDSQLPTFKGRNKGHGRHSRKIRYQEGKSF